MLLWPLLGGMVSCVVMALVRRYGFMCLLWPLLGGMVSCVVKALVRRYGFMCC